MAKREKLLSELQAHLEPGEEVLEAVEGTWETKTWGDESSRSGILAATDRRLVLFAKKLFGHDVKSFPYASVSSFEVGKRFRSPYVKFDASKKRFRLNWVKSEDLEGFGESVRGRIAAAVEATAEP